MIRIRKWHASLVITCLVIVCYFAFYICCRNTLSVTLSTRLPSSNGFPFKSYDVVYFSSNERVNRPLYYLFFPLHRQELHSWNAFKDALASNDARLIRGDEGIIVAEDVRFLKVNGIRLR